VRYAGHGSMERLTRRSELPPKILVTNMIPD
jgi:hypothetical protein